MWGKNSKPVQEPLPAAPAPAAEPPRREIPVQREPLAAAPAAPAGSRIGPGISIRGDVRGNEDLLIEGEVQGSVRLEAATATIGRHGRVRADVEAREILVEGRVEGTLNGRERVRIAASGIVHGNVHTQRIAIDDGAILQGSVEIVRPGEAVRSTQPARSFAASANAPKSAAAAGPAKSTQAVAVAAGSASSDEDGQ